MIRCTSGIRAVTPGGFLALMRAVLMPAALMAAMPSPAQAPATNDLFRAVEEVREKAEKASAPLLAPGSYQEAVRLAERVRRETATGQPVDAQRLEESQRLFQAALDHTRIAAVTFEKTLAGRDAARAFEPWKYAPSFWQTAEKQFDDAARRVEKGDLQAGSESAALAMERYAEAGR